MSPVPRKKVVVVGDGDTGKTCLLLSFSQDKFLTDYVPTVFETYITDMEVSHRKAVRVRVRSCHYSYAMRLQHSLQYENARDRFISLFSEHVTAFCVTV